MGIIIGTPTEMNFDSQLVIDFFKNEWSRPIALGDTEFYNWQFINVPLQNLNDSCCIAVEDEKIVGVMGVNERPFYLNGHERKGAELTTWIVMREYRTKGIGPKMINYLKLKHEILIGMGITDDALTVYLRSGFRYYNAIPRFVKVLEWNTVESYGKCTSLAKKVSKYWNNQQTQFAYLIEKINDNSLYTINQKLRMTKNFFSRSTEFMQWRYEMHPTFSYKTRIIRDKLENSNGVVVVLRTEISQEGLRILHVVDFFGDEKDMPAGLQYIEDQGKKYSVGIIDFFCTNSAINSFFVASGWFSTLDDTYFEFPHLFQPVELRKPATTSMIYWEKEEMGKLCDIGKMYITKQDCDFDRPVLKDKQ